MDRKNENGKINWKNEPWKRVDENVICGRQSMAGLWVAELWGL